MKNKETIIEKIYNYTLEEIMGDRFGAYAKNIIQERALPDVRDGLKPVQRRILYSMYENHNTCDKPYRKCAKAVGDVMGKYHPHGDSSIYGALIYMSQTWKMRDIFVDVHGNNGSVDGDGPAAYRYTEARLSKIANVMLSDLSKDTVEMTLNYSDEDLEPTVLPSAFPNLLVNGSTGISAGYATNIPPHNLGEVIDATIFRIDNPNCRLDTILSIVKGPDFPTGGIVEGKENLRKVYETGRGKVIVRSHTEVVEEKGKKKIIISDIPYEVLKEQLKKKIEDIKFDKKIDGILDVIDDSDKKNIARLILDIKKDANADLIINYLMKNTDLQVNYNYNIVAIVNKRPKTLGLLEILDAFIEFKKEVVTKRTEFDLKHALARLHIIEGLMKAMSILDEVIKVIRASKNKQDAINNLVKEFDFTIEQATAIVMMQLYRLTNTDITQLQEEMNKLKQEVDLWTKILSNEEALKHVMKNDLKYVKKEYASDRKTEIKDEITEIKIDLTDTLPKEDVVVVVTKEGYVKRVSKRSYTSDETGLKQGDHVIGKYELNTLDSILLFTDLGNYLYVPVYEIPDIKWKELGKHISNIIQIKSNENIIYSTPYVDNKVITLATKQGMIKRTKIEEFKVSRYTKPMCCMKLKDDDLLVSVDINNYNNVVLTTYNGYGLIYDTLEIGIVGIKGSGVKGINLKNDSLIGMSTFNENYEYLSIVTDKNTGKRIRLSDIEKTSRAKKGVQIIRDVKTNPYRIIKTFVENSKELLEIINTEGTIQIKLTELPILDRYSTGSVISKHKIFDIYKIKNLETKEIKELKKEEYVISENELPSIDQKMMTIDDFLDDFKEM